MHIQGRGLFPCQDKSNILSYRNSSLNIVVDVRSMFVYFRHKRNHDDDKKESDKENMYRSSEWKERKKTIDLYNKNHAKTFDSIEFNGMNTSASRR